MCQMCSETLALSVSLFQVFWSTSKCHRFQEKFQHKRHSGNRNFRTLPNWFQTISIQPISFWNTIVKCRAFIQIRSLIQIFVDLGGCWRYVSYHSTTFASGKEGLNASFDTFGRLHILQYLFQNNFSVMFNVEKSNFLGKECLLFPWNYFLVLKGQKWRHYIFVMNLFIDQKEKCP